MEGNNFITCNMIRNVSFPCILRRLAKEFLMDVYKGQIVTEILFCTKKKKNSAAIDCLHTFIIVRIFHYDQSS